MAKAGDKIVDAQGQEWRYTQGGNWRLYKNGKATDTLSKTQPGAGATPEAAKPGATDAGASQPTTINNVAPSNLSPEGAQWLNIGWQNLQKQVADGLITQEQALAQGQNNNALIASETPAQQAERLNLQGKVQQGLINYSDLENQMYQIKQAANQTSPQTGVNLTPESTTSQVTNEIADVAKGSAIQETLLTNANQQNPFGNQTVTVDPNTGQPIVKQELSKDNQQVLSGIQGTSNVASGVVQNLIGDQYDRFLSGAGPQSGYSDPELEKAIYSRLTQGFDQQDKREQEDFEQRLANRGIGVGSGEGYTNAMRDFQTAKNERYENARNNATIQGTQTALQRQATNVGALGAVTGGIGTLGQTAQAGFYQPNFQQFNAATVQQPDVQGLYNTQYAGQLTREQIASQEKQQQMQIEAQKALAKGIGGGGGGEESSGGNKAFATRPPGS